MCSEKGNGKGKGMDKAYTIAQELVRDRLKNIDPDAYREIQDIKEADVIVIRGTYDFIEQVLTMAKTPFTLVNPGDFRNVELRADQIVFVNCPGDLSREGLRSLERFVASGGFLFTTDWALRHVLEPAFPGYVEYNNRATRDEVVRVELLDTEDPFLKSLIGPNDDPQWWLEGSSYPITILNKEKVRVLVSSREIEQKYGESPVFVTFDYGEGKVYHMISHFYLQRSETRTARQKASAGTYLNEKEISPAMRMKYEKMGIAEAQLGDVESAYTSASMMNKILYDKKMQMRKKKDGR